MGGGPEFPIQHDDVPSPSTHNHIADTDITLQHPLNSPLNSLVIDEDMKQEEKEGILDGPDVEADMDEPTTIQHKQELLRELKALGFKVPVK